MKWFRLYSEVIHDPKVQRMPLAMRWRWLELLCMANDQDPRGLLPSTDDIAYILRISRKAAAESVAYLIDKGLLDADSSGNVRPHNWTGRQPNSDDAAERMANKRRTSSEQVRPREEERRTEQNRTEKSREDAPARRDIFVLYDQYMGKPSITEMIAPDLIEADKAYAPECIRHCFEEAAQASDGRRSWKYVKKILERHEREGCESSIASGSESGSRSNTNGLAAGVRGLDERLATQLEQRRKRSV